MILIVQIYVDDIIFGSTNDKSCKEFSQKMTREFEMFHIGELSYFLGLQIIQVSNGIFINQENYCNNLIKRFRMENTFSKPTPMSTTAHLGKDENGKS